jgi:Flp pilus assembly protein CpaB
LHSENKFCELKGTIMRLGRTLILLAFVVILALVAVYLLLNQGGPPGETPGVSTTTDIVIVVQPIPRGGVITAEALGYIAYPTDQTIQGMLTNINDAAGQRARYDLQPGIPLVQNMIVGSADELSETGSDSALLIPPGMVAFPIPVDRFSSLAYGLRAGDHVNVIASMQIVDLDQELQTRLPNDVALLSFDPNTNTLTVEIVAGGDALPEEATALEALFGGGFYVVPSEVQRPRLVSHTLLQNVVILHIGNFLFTDERGNEVSLPPAGVDATGQPIPASAEPPDLITLIVTPQDAVTLNYLVYSGAELTLALRSAGDDSIASIEAVTLQYLLNTYQIPVPVKLPYGLQPRIDILTSPTQEQFPLPPAQ